MRRRGGGDKGGKEGRDKKRRLGDQPAKKGEERAVKSMKNEDSNLTTTYDVKKERLDF